MGLSDAKVRNAKPSEKPKKYFDGGGLHLLVTPSGGKLWRLKYRYGGKEKSISLGKYPQVGLKDARNRRDTMKRHLAFGRDPSQVRKDQKRARANVQDFEDVARGWHGAFRPKWEAKTAKTIRSRLEKEVFPKVGTRPIDEIEPPDLLEILERIRDEGHLGKADRILQHLDGIFQYAIAHGQARWNPAQALRGAIPHPQPDHYPTIIDPRKVGELLNAIDHYFGTPQVNAALQLLPLIFVRPGELRYAEWSEFDLQSAVWRLPAFKMKRRDFHTVPLSRQALSVVEALYPITGNHRYLFPSVRSLERPISPNTINQALRRMGYNKDEFVAHAFRSMASTLLNENGWDKDLVELQLAHKSKGTVRQAYDFSERLEERREMVQWWADYLDKLCLQARERKVAGIDSEPTNPFSPRLLIRSKPPQS